MRVQNYLFFDGRCEEALQYYKSAIGAEVGNMMRFKDGPVSADCPDPAMAALSRSDKIMHASFRVGQTEIMASDGHCTGTPIFKGFALSLAAQTDADATRLFTALSDGGQITMPLGKTFFSSCFGMLTDRFGVMWMVLVAP